MGFVLLFITRTLNTTRTSKHFSIYTSIWNIYQLFDFLPRLPIFPTIQLHFSSQIYFILLFFFPLHCYSPINIPKNSNECELSHNKCSFIFFSRNLYQWLNSMLASSAADCWFWPQSDQTKDFRYKIGICCFFANHAVLRRKNKDWLARNRDNVSEWGDMSIHELLYQWASTIKIQLNMSV